MLSLLQDTEMFFKPGDKWFCDERHPSPLGQFWSYEYEGSFEVLLIPKSVDETTRDAMKYAYECGRRAGVGSGKEEVIRGFKRLMNIDLFR